MHEYTRSLTWDTRVTDDIECEIVEPRQAVHPHSSCLPIPPLTFIALSVRSPELKQAIPLSQKCRDVGTGVWFELEHALLRKDVRNELALTRVLRAGARAHDTSRD